jgi:uncharacterized membrane protein
MRQGTAHIFPSISIPSSFFLIFSRSKWSVDFGCFLALWAGLPHSVLSWFLRDWANSNSAHLFFLLLGSALLHSRTSHKSPTLLPFRHCVLYREKIRVPFVCCHTNNDNSSGIISFLFLSLSLAQFQWRHSPQFRQNAINDNGKWGGRERKVKYYHFDRLGSALMVMSTRLYTVRYVCIVIISRRLLCWGPLSVYVTWRSTDTPWTRRQ